MGKSGNTARFDGGRKVDGLTRDDFEVVGELYVRRTVLDGTCKDLRRCGEEWGPS